MADEKVEALERRLRRLEGLFLVLFANDAEWPEDDRFLFEVIERFGRFPDPPFFEELLHRLIRRKPSGRLSQLERKFERLEATVGENQVGLHQFLSLAAMGAPIDEVPLLRIVPMRVYLKHEDEQLQEELAKAVVGFAASFGIDIADDLPAVKGSWFKRWFGRTREALKEPEVRERLEKGERALELHALQKPQAVIDKDQAEGAAALITALEKTDAAVCQVGSILILKANGGVVARTLTQKELIHLEKHPELLKAPDEILAALSAAAGESKPAQVASLPPPAKAG